MLNYLKDENQVPAVEAMKDSQGGSQEHSVSKQEDYLTVSGHGKKLRQSTILLALLFAVGGAGVWFMIKKTTPAAANAAPSQDQAQLEAALAQLKTMQTEMDSQMDSVVGRFYQFSNVNQVSVNELKKNPFVREFNVPSAEETQEEVSLVNQLQYLRDQAQKQAMGLELWSITSTPRGMCCMINDEVLYEGDTIQGMTVKRIQGKRVTLEYQGMPIDLKMD